MTAILHAVFAPGFFASAPVHLALLTGGVAAFVSGAVGAFAVLRGQSYAGHALADISVTGGSGSYLIGVSPLLGFAGVGVLAAAVMDMIGIRRPRGRDLATGIVRGAGLGLAALFLYWDTTHSNVSGATITILFGSMFTISSSLLPVITILGLSLPDIVAGAVIAESIFNFPGMGLLFWQSALAHDFPVMLGGTLVIGVATVLGNLAADVAYGMLDPRIRYGRT